MCTGKRQCGAAQSTVFVVGYLIPRLVARIVWIVDAPQQAVSGVVVSLVFAKAQFSHTRPNLHAASCSLSELSVPRWPT
jgi:hypothetical protein